MSTETAQLGQPATDVPGAGTDDLQLWSVTTLLGALDKPALLYWAPEQTALAAIHSEATWRGMLADDDPDCAHDGPDCAAVKWLRDARFRRPKGIRSATELGTLVHDACEEYALTGTRPDVDDEVRPFLDRFDDWLDRFQPSYQATEVTVYHPGLGYAGTADAFLTIDGVRFLADYKGLDITTPIPTPAGWSTMAALQEGDHVFAPDGRPTRVVVKSEVHERPCSRITFDDGTSIICDDEHRWAVKSTSVKALSGDHLPPPVLRTDELATHLRHPVTGQRHLAITLAAPLALPEASLPVDPYVYGCWLGDGSVGYGTITKPDEELFGLIEARGYEIGAPIGKDQGQCRGRTVYKLRTDLRQAGLLNTRVIPNVYLRASVEQRLDLLRGLMDTDGSYNRTRNQVDFTTVDKVMASSVHDLATGLGERAHIHTVQAHGFGLDVTAYHVTWSPQHRNPFSLSRKADLVTMQRKIKASRRLIVSVEQIPTVPTQCITVDSTTECYLAGEQMIITHNSSRKSVDGRGRPTMPYPEQVGLQLAAYRHATHAAVWRPRRMEKWRRRYYLLGPDEQAMAQPVPEVDTGLVIHITPDHCEAYPIQIGEDVFEAFLAVQDAARWLFQTSRTVMSDPLTPTTKG